MIRFVRHTLMLLHAVGLTACAASLHNTVAQGRSPGVSATHSEEPHASIPASPAANHNAAPLPGASQEKPVMAIAGADAALNPAQSAEEIGQRFLKLLGAVSSKSDITVEHV